MLGKRLTQDPEARRPEIIDGMPLDTMAAFPTLTAAEDQQFEINKDNLKGKAAKPARAIAEKYDRDLAKKIAKKTGKTFESTLRQVKMRHRHQLAPEWELEFDHLGIGTVGDITANPAKYENETLADPLEGVSYGRNKAKVMLDQITGRPFINSFAHGGAYYELLLDEVVVAEAVGKAGADAVDVLAALLAQLMADTGSIDRLKAQAAKQAGIGKREINDRLKPELDRLKKADRKAEREAAANDQ